MDKIYNVFNIVSKIILEKGLPLSISGCNYDKTAYYAVRNKENTKFVLMSAREDDDSIYFVREPLRTRVSKNNKIIYLRQPFLKKKMWEGYCSGARNDLDKIVNVYKFLLNRLTV